jgi:hypothetical protein
LRGELLQVGEKVGIGGVGSLRLLDQRVEIGDQLLQLLVAGLIALRLGAAAPGLIGALLGRGRLPGRAGKACRQAEGG